MQGDDFTSRSRRTTTFSPGGRGGGSDYTAPFEKEPRRSFRETNGRKSADDALLSSFPLRCETLLCLSFEMFRQCRRGGFAPGVREGRIEPTRCFPSSSCRAARRVYLKQAGGLTAVKARHRTERRREATRICRANCLRKRSADAAALASIRADSRGGLARFELDSSETKARVR